MDIRSVLEAAYSMPTAAPAWQSDLLLKLELAAAARVAVTPLRDTAPDRADAAT